jgi:adenine-specific DNA methylase
MEELEALRPKILAEAGEERGEAVVHLLAFVVDKLANWNCILSSWNIQAQTVRSLFDRHDFAFKSTYSEMAPVVAGGGLRGRSTTRCRRLRKSPNCQNMRTAMQPSSVRVLRLP